MATIGLTARLPQFRTIYHHNKRSKGKVFVGSSSLRACLRTTHPAVGSQHYIVAEPETEELPVPKADKVSPDPANASCDTMTTV